MKFPDTAEQAFKDGWKMYGILPHPKIPTGIRTQLTTDGSQVADLGFTQKGKQVPKGQYALWYRTPQI